MKSTKVGNMAIKRFEDLECWQGARILTQIIYRYANRPQFSKDYRLTGQITGAAISVMNNISEGFDSASNKEFIRFLIYSRRSCSEIQNCLYIALDQHYISKKEFSETYNHCTRVRKIIDGLIRYLRNHLSATDQRALRPTDPSGFALQATQRQAGPRRANGKTGQRTNGPTAP